MLLHRHLYLAFRHRQVDRFLRETRFARDHQHEVLLSKVRRNANSEFGRVHGFDRVRSLEDFRKQVPITTYAYYRPWIDRVKQGEVTAMFSPETRVHMFAMTSGTTDQSKFIPVTDEFFREYRRGWNLWGLHVYWEHRRLLGQLNVQLSSDWRQFVTEAGIPCGNISGLAAETAPLISRPMFVIPKELMKIKEPEAKQYAALRLSLMRREVGMMMTANPSTLVEFARLADRRREDLIRDLYDGTLAEDVPVSREIRRALRRRLGRAPARARELERIVACSGHLFPRDFWPDMSLLAVWTGGSVGAYLPRVREYYGDVPVRDHGLSASEGRMTIPIEDGTSAGILDYDTQFFEFIPEDEHDSDDPTILEAHELQEGRNYFILLTTSSGFYRYDIHDVVRCTGHCGEAPLLEFLNKGSHFSSITGEKISENQVTTAMRQAFDDLGLPVDLYSVAPQWGDPPGYVLLVEPGPHVSRSEELGRLFDEHLAELNCEYANRLETRRLHPIQVQEVPPGTWLAYRDRRLKSRGGSIEQYKHRCLQSDMQFLDELQHLDLGRFALIRSA